MFRLFIVRDHVQFQGEEKELIRELGTYKATVDFGNGQNTEVDLEVVAE